MKTFMLIFLFMFASACSAQQVNGHFTVYKIITTEDGDSVLFIKNSMINGIVVMDNDSLTVDDTFKKIKLQSKYTFILDRDEKNFRGEPIGGYMIISNSGNTQKIWDVKKDGPMPMIFSARNLHGLYIKEDYKESNK